MARRPRWQRDLYGRDASNEAPPGGWTTNLGRVFYDATRDIADRATDRAQQAWWASKGGPWVARYRSGFGSLVSIGGWHEEHFATPEEAVEFFDGLPRRFRRNLRLRSSCMVEFKDTGSIIEPYAGDVETKMAQTKREVARIYGWHHPGPVGSDRRRWRRSKSGRTRQTRTSPR